MTKNNDHIADFNLFQEQSEYSNRILEEAKKLKAKIQDLYKTVVTDCIPLDKYWALDFDVKISQVSEQIEPGSIKLFTRQYTPVLRVYYSSVFMGEIIFEKEESKIINKYINELFVGDSVSQEYFFDIAKQYFLLDFIYKKTLCDDINILKQRIKNYIPEFDLDANPIFCINCKLRGRPYPLHVNPNLHSAICHINKIWDNLCSFSKYIFIGNYRNYSNENELVLQINNHCQSLIQETISNYFQNDFLLLNNMEFLDETPYTNDWSEEIFSPMLLETRGYCFCLKDVAREDVVSNDIFLFQKSSPDGIFFKTEILLPNCCKNQEIFLQMVSLSKDILKLKKHEEKH